MKSRFLKVFGIAVFTLAPAVTANSQDVPPDATNETIRPKKGRQPVNRIVATVNGDTITLNELRIKMTPIQAALQERFPKKGPDYEEKLYEYGSSILNDLIDRTIIFTEYKDVARFSDNQIEEEVKRIVETVYNGDEKLFQEYLKKTNLSRDQFKEQQRKELLVQVVRSQHYGDIATPKEAELRAEYEKWKRTNRDRTKDVATYRGITLPKGRPSDSEAQFAKAKELATKIKAGGDFAESAKEHSLFKREEGGLYEDIRARDVNPSFGQLLFETEGNDVIGPIDLGPYLFIFQVIERKLGPSKPFTDKDVREELKRSVISAKKKANFDKWMKKMRSRAVIKKML